MLIEAINSVLNQTQKSLEIIVVDDCSTDGTEEYVKSIKDERVRYFRNEKNMGQHYGRMFGLRNAGGKYITFLDHDDYYTDYEFFAKAVKIFEENNSSEAPLAFVCANAWKLVTSTNEKMPSNIGNLGRIKGIDYILKPQYSKPLSVFPTLFSAEILRRAGFENMIIFDTTTYIKAALLGDVWFMPEIIGVWRVHGGNTTFGPKNHPEYDRRYYSESEEDIKRWKAALDNLSLRAPRSELSLWYAETMINLMNYKAISHPSIKDMLHTMCIILKESGFMPKLWLKLAPYFIREVLRHITPLRKLYRFIKYRCRGKPYPKD